MKITADTNLLVRAMTGDDERQSGIARDALTNAEIVALTLPALCELAWVLSRGYKVSAQEIATGMRRLINGANVMVNRAATEAGLSMLDEGGDFADGVIAFEGAWLGAKTFVSFDKRAVALLGARGQTARLIG